MVQKRRIFDVQPWTSHVPRQGECLWLLQSHNIAGACVRKQFHEARSWQCSSSPIVKQVTFIKYVVRLVKRPVRLAIAVPASLNLQQASVHLTALVTLLLLLHSTWDWRTTSRAEDCWLIGSASSSGKVSGGDGTCIICSACWLSCYFFQVEDLPTQHMTEILHWLSTLPWNLLSWRSRSSFPNQATGWDSPMHPSHL